MAGRKIPQTSPLPLERGLTAKERDLWRQVTRQVARLRPAPSEETAPPPLPLPPPLTAETGAPPLLPNRSAPPARAKVNAGGGVEVGRFEHLDRATARRFAQGARSFDATLDLHGMTQFTAHARLVDFILMGWRRGWRCVLIVTGKGVDITDRRPWPEPESRGILRRAVPQWLNEAPLRGKILALTQARPQHGGLGAFYVLIRRNRQGGEE